MKPLLKDVTLYIIATIKHQANKAAIEKCTEHFNFGDIIIGSDQNLNVPNSVHVACSSTINFDTVERLWFYGPPYIKTSHVLTIHDDSWIIHPELWTDEYLKYDYIGAPWHWDRNIIGNGGFSLRSRSLYNALNSGGFVWHHPEDDAICRTHRYRLETDYGIKWAPLAIAQQFSAENYNFVPYTFGFHGKQIMQHVLENEK